MVKILEVDFNEDEARAVAEQYFIEYTVMIDSGDYTSKELNLALTNVQNLRDNTNIEEYMYPASLLNSIEIDARDLLSVNASRAPEDIHYMTDEDSLAVMADSYYGNVDSLVLIQRNNGIYNTEEGVRKGILRIINRDGV